MIPKQIQYVLTMAKVWQWYRCSLVYIGMQGLYWMKWHWYLIQIYEIDMSRHYLRCSNNPYTITSMIFRGIISRSEAMQVHRVELSDMIIANYILTYMYMKTLSSSDIEDAVWTVIFFIVVQSIKVLNNQCQHLPKLSFKLFVLPICQSLGKPIVWTATEVETRIRGNSLSET